MQRLHMSAAYWLTPHVFFSLLINYLLRGGSTHSELGTPTSIINQENNLKSYLKINLVGINSQVKVPLSKKTLA